MATLVELEAMGWVWKLVPDLPLQELELRTLYTSRSAKTWIERVLPSLSSDSGTEIEPITQLDDLLALFSTGGKLTHGRQFHVMHPRAEGVWELKTPDLRLFGWFPEKDCFVLVCCEAVRPIKARRPTQLDLYQKCINQVIGFRQSLPLNDPKFVRGSDPDGVVST
jgi:hypothetical protein